MQSGYFRRCPVALEPCLEEYLSSLADQGSFTLEFHSPLALGFAALLRKGNSIWNDTFLVSLAHLIRGYIEHSSDLVVIARLIVKKTWSKWAFLESLLMIFSFSFWCNAQSTFQQHRNACLVLLSFYRKKNCFFDIWNALDFSYHLDFTVPSLLEGQDSPRWIIW